MLPRDDGKRHATVVCFVRGDTGKAAPEKNEDRRIINAFKAVVEMGVHLGASRCVWMLHLRGSYK